LLPDDAQAAAIDVNKQSAANRAEDDAGFRLTGMDPVLEWHDAPLERASD
jgi:hypothetical protein